MNDLSIIGGYPEYIPIPYTPMKIGADISTVPNDAMIGLTLTATTDVLLQTLPRADNLSSVIGVIPKGFPIGDIYTYIINKDGTVYWQVINNQFQNPVGAASGNPNKFWVLNKPLNFDQSSIQKQIDANQAAANPDTSGPFDFLTDLFKPNPNDWISGVPNVITIGVGGILVITVLSTVSSFRKVTGQDDDDTMWYILGGGILAAAGYAIYEKNQ